MRAAFWLLALFGIAVAAALFAGNNQGTVTLFWPPYRIDLSLNLVLVLLLAAFVFLYTALRALAALFDLPRQALRWRISQRERAINTALVDGLSHLLAGRFLRARRSAQLAIAQEQALRIGGHAPANTDQLRSMSHLIGAESAQSLRDRAARDEHLTLALEPGSSSQAQETREAALLRAARWALDDRDPQAAMDWLHQLLPHGAARRTLALRLKLKAARQAGRTAEALETARLLAKHRAFSTGAAQSILRGLAIDQINTAHDTAQLERAWQALEPTERAMPELAVHAALRMAALGGDAVATRAWLLPAWEGQRELSDSLRTRLVKALEDGFESLDAGWLARIEAAQLQNPRDATLQYLAGMACMKRQLWGKAQQLLTQAALGLQDVGLRRNAWSGLAQLAEQRGDVPAASEAWKRAAQG